MVKAATTRVRASAMSKRMFDEGEVGWPDSPPIRAPVFVLTHHASVPWVRQGGTTFTFVTEGIESALGQAESALGQAVAAAGDKDVRIAGGANSAQRFIEAYARGTAATGVWEGKR